MFCDEPLSEFVIVILISVPLKAPAISIPVPSMKSKSLEPVKSVGVKWPEAPLFVLICVFCFMSSCYLLN